MAVIKIKRMYHRNSFGDYTAAKVTFNALDAKGDMVLTKQVVAKIGTIDSIYNHYRLDLGGTAATRVEAVIPAGDVCEWELVR
jgi:hypothetical protein